MREDLIRKIERVGEEAKIEILPKDDNIISITNFKIKEKERGDGKGSRIINSIVDICENSSEVEEIEIHIGLTWREKEGFPDNKNISQDPSIKFLKKMKFDIVDYGPNKTVLAKKKV